MTESNASREIIHDGDHTKEVLAILGAKIPAESLLAISEKAALILKKSVTVPGTKGTG